MTHKYICRLPKAAATFVAAALCIAPGGAVVAQTGTTIVERQNTHQTGLEWIRVRNMRSGLMAWMLDPSHNPEPVEVLSARQADGKTLRPADLFDIPADFKLPAGIVSVTSIDAQNALAVVGTPQGVQELRVIVEERDRRIPQVEIEAKFISVSPAEFEQLGIVDFMGTQAVGEGELKTTAIPANFHQRLDSLVAQGKARIMNSPRVTTMYRLPSSLGSRISVPAQLTVDKSNRALTDLQQQLDALPRESQAWVGVYAFLRAKPTAIDEDMVTLELATVQNLQVTESWKPGVSQARARLQSQPAVTLKSTEQSAVLKVKNGESMLVRGLFPLWVTESLPTTGSFAVVTVRSLHRS